MGDCGWSVAGVGAGVALPKGFGFSELAGRGWAETGRAGAGVEESEGSEGSASSEALALGLGGVGTPSRGVRMSSAGLTAVACTNSMLLAVPSSSVPRTREGTAGPY